MNVISRGVALLLIIALWPLTASADDVITYPPEDVIYPPEVEIGCIPPHRPNCPPLGEEPCLPPMYPAHPPCYPICQECHWMWPNPMAWCRKVYGHSADHPPFAPWVESPCGSVDCDFMPPSPPPVRRYITTFDAVTLFPNDPDLVAFASTFAATFTSTNAIDTGVAPRVSLIVPADKMCDVEGAYFGLDSWHVAADYLLPAGGTGRLDFNSELHSSELNFRHHVRDWLTVLCGFRYVEYAELIEFNAPAVNLPALWRLDTQNFFYGLQLGADVGLIRMFDRLELTGVVKAGVFDNHADWRHEVHTIGGSSFFENQFDEVAFIGEGSLGFTFRCSEHSALRGGYQVLVLEDVANAITSFTEPDGLGGLIFHGAYAGIELRW